MSAMRSLEERLRAVEDEREILRTMHQYAHTMAYGGEEEAFLDCFTEDAVCEPFPRDPTRPPTVGRAEGRAGLVQFYRQHRHAPASYYKHAIMDQRMSFDGDTATVDSFYMVPEEILYDDGTRGLELQSMGRYRDKFVRCPDGRWRIADRRIEIEARRRGEIGRGKA